MRPSIKGGVDPSSERLLPLRTSASGFNALAGPWGVNMNNIRRQRRGVVREMEASATDEAGRSTTVRPSLSVMVALTGAYILLLLPLSLVVLMIATMSMDGGTNAFLLLFGIASLALPWTTVLAPAAGWVFRYFGRAKAARVCMSIPAALGIVIGIFVIWAFNSDVASAQSF